MRTRSIFFFSIFFTLTAFTFLAKCSGNQKDGNDEHEAHGKEEHATESTTVAESNEPRFQVDATFQQQLGDVFTAYVSLKDAFVSSDRAKIKAEARKTKNILSKVEMKLLTGAAHNDWMNYVSPMEKSLQEMQEYVDIELQRKAFSIVSENLYKSIKAFGLGGQEAFYDYCPMAFNNDGAYWLSDEAQIKNPYFGEKMLTCGSVKEKLK
jgi:Cu(I)/Ag(I) efflux system membrane fusion protein